MRFYWRIIFIALFLCFLFYGVSVYGDYDVSSNYRKTEFNSSKWIQSYHNCTLNMASGLVYLDKEILDYSLNPSTFTKVGDGITTTATQVTHEYDRLETSYLYKDYGNGFFIPEKEIALNFTIKESSVDPYRNWGSIGLANDLNGYSQVSGYEIIILNYANPTGSTITLREMNNGVIVNYHSYSGLTQFTWYYCTFKIENGDALLYVYDDVDRNNLIAFRTITLENDDFSYRYLYLAQSSDEGTGETSKSLGYSKDYNLKYKEYYGSGVIYTKNLLENTTDKSVLIGINSTAAKDTHVQLYGSSDNSTWKLLIDNDGLDELMQYREVLYNYSSLYVRLNLTTSDPLVTPFVDELFYLHTYECVAVSETKPYVFIILFTIIGMLLGYAVDRT